MFPDLLWSRPENKLHAGKLLVIGGNSFGFSAVGEAYAEARKAGAGEVRVLMPDAIKKIVGGVFEHALFVASTRAGSLAKEALRDCLDAATWADAVLIVGDVSRNAETASLLEQFAEHYKGQLTVTKDALELLLKQNDAILQREHTTLVMTMSDLQKAAQIRHLDEALTFEISLEVFAERIRHLLDGLACSIMVRRHELIITAHAQMLSVTDSNPGKWRVKAATNAAVWRLQNPEKPFESLTTSIISEA